MKKNKALRTLATGTMVSSLVLSAMATPIKAIDGWANENGSWSYVNGGKKQTGWEKIGNSWFAFDEGGKMLTGWVASDKFWYWLSPGSGVMQENTWITDNNGGTFYLESNGVQATDTVKDGFEIKSDGTRIPLTESNSVVLGSEGLAEGTVIEGNLYISKEAAKDLELKGITVKGKIVIEGGETVKITDSKVNEIKMNQANVNVTLAGKTEVKSVLFTKEANLNAEKNYKGEIKTIEVTSLVKNETTIAVKADNVATNSWAPLAIEANVKNLSVANETEVKVGKDIVIDKIEANAPMVVSGDGTVKELEANSPGVKSDAKVDKVTGDKKDDVTNSEGGVVEKPSTGGGSSGGSSGGSGGGGNTDTETDAALKTKLHNAIETAVGPTNVKLEGIAILTLSVKQVNVEFANQDATALDVLTTNFLGELFTYADIKTVKIGDEVLEVPAADAAEEAKTDFSIKVMKQVAIVTDLTDAKPSTPVTVLHGKEVPIELACQSASGKNYSDVYTVNFIDPVQKLDEAVSAAVATPNESLDKIATLDLTDDVLAVNITNETATVLDVYATNFLAAFFDYEEINEIKIKNNNDEEIAEEVVDGIVSGDKVTYAKIMAAVARVAGIESATGTTLAKVLRGTELTVTLYGKTTIGISYEKAYTINFQPAQD